MLLIWIFFSTFHFTNVSFPDHHILLASDIFKPPVPDETPNTFRRIRRTSPAWHLSWTASCSSMWARQPSCQWCCDKKSAGYWTSIVLMIFLWLRNGMYCCMAAQVTQWQHWKRPPWRRAVPQQKTDDLTGHTHPTSYSYCYLLVILLLEILVAKKQQVQLQWKSSQLAFVAREDAGVLVGSMEQRGCVGSTN